MELHRGGGNDSLPVFIGSRCTNNVSTNLADSHVIQSASAWVGFKVCQQGEMEELAKMGVERCWHYEF